MVRLIMEKARKEENVHIPIKDKNRFIGNQINE